MPAPGPPRRKMTREEGVKRDDACARREGVEEEEGEGEEREQKGRADVRVGGRRRSKRVRRGALSIAWESWIGNLRFFVH